MPEEIKPIVLKLTAPPVIRPKKKIKVLWYSDFLRSTGFGNVAEELVTRLDKTGKYEIVVLGINYNGVPYCTPASDYFHLRHIPVYPAYSVRPTGSLFGYDVLEHFLFNQDIDIFFALQDSFNMLPITDVIAKARKKKKFKYIFYFPVDGNVHQNWVENAIDMADYPVTYTEFGKREVMDFAPKKELQVIGHGVNTEKFFPAFANEKEKNEFKKEYFGVSKNVKIITNVNRNQPRKDLPRNILAFWEFCKKYPDIDARLYMHCSVHDPAGHKLQTFTKRYLPEVYWDKIIFPQDSAMRGNGIKVEVLNKIYSASDIVTSTTTGEGWGLSLVEAMACKIPVVFPNNSAITEIIGKNEERGYLVECGKEFFVQKYDNELLRPLTDINSLIQKWYIALTDAKQTDIKVQNAFDWVQGYTWDILAKNWEEVFNKAYASKLKIK